MPKVTDPAVLAQLNGGQSAGPKKVTDPAVLAQLNSQQDEYAAALQKIRETQFPGMSDAQWKEYSAKAFPANDFKGLAQHGQLFGLTDEIDAGIGALGSQVRNWFGDTKAPGFGEAYGDYKQLAETRRDLGREQQGGMGVFAEILGGASGFAPSAASVNVAAPLWQKALSGGAQGAAFGGAYGAGNADDNRLIEGLKGAGIGAGAGIAIPAIAQGAGAVWGNIANRVAANKAAGQIGTSPGAARFLSATMAADDSLGPAGRARMSAAGGEAMLADAGPSAQNALDYAIQSSGKAGMVASDAINARVSRDAQALTDALDAAMGKPAGVQTTRTAIAKDSASARRTAYDNAYNSPIDYSSPEGMQLDELLSRVDQSDINAANALMRAEGHQSRQIMAQVAPDGTVTYMRKPDVRQIDYITRALNDRAAQNAGLGALGGQTNVGRVYGNLSGEIRDTARTAVPAYDNALNTAADPIRRSQAVEFGSTILMPSTTREQVGNAVLRMTGPEREAVAQGLRSRFDDLLANVTRTVQDGDVAAREAIRALKELSSRANRQKITMVLGTKRANALFAEVDRVTKSFELRASVADNSKTFQRQAMDRRVSATTDPQGTVPTLMRGEPLNAGKRLIQFLTGQTPEMSLAQREMMLEEVVKMLTMQKGRAVTAMEALRFLAAQTGATQGIKDGIIRGGASLAAPIGLQAEQRLSAMQ